MCVQIRCLRRVGVDEAEDYFVLAVTRAFSPRLTVDRISRVHGDLSFTKHAVLFL